MMGPRFIVMTKVSKVSEDRLRREYERLLNVQNYPILV
jgi:hypothetical protein